MGVFDFLKPKKEEQGLPKKVKTYFVANIDIESLPILVHKAFNVFINNPNFDNEQIKAQIFAFTHDERLALAFYRFIPIAFCRLIFPEPEYADEYVIFRTATDTDEYKLMDDDIYKIILSSAKKEVSESQNSREEFRNILNHSPTFNALKEAINNGEDLSAYQMSPTVFPDLDYFNSNGL